MKSLTETKQHEKQLGASDGTPTTAFSFSSIIRPQVVPSLNLVNKIKTDQPVPLSFLPANTLQSLAEQHKDSKVPMKSEAGAASKLGLQKNVDESLKAILLSVGELYVKKLAEREPQPLTDLLLKSKVAQYQALKTMSDEMSRLQGMITKI